MYTQPYILAITYGWLTVLSFPSANAAIDQTCAAQAEVQQGNGEGMKFQ